MEDEEDIMNKSEERMIEFCIINDMRIGNTFWKQEIDAKHTYVAQGTGVKSIIDFIIYTKAIG